MGVVGEECCTHIITSLVASSCWLLTKGKRSVRPALRHGPTASVPCSLSHGPIPPPKMPLSFSPDCSGASWGDTPVQAFSPLRLNFLSQSFADWTFFYQRNPSIRNIHPPSSLILHQEQTKYRLSDLAGLAFSHGLNRRPQPCQQPPKTRRQNRATGSSRKTSLLPPTLVLAESPAKAHRAHPVRLLKRKQLKRNRSKSHLSTSHQQDPNQSSAAYATKRKENTSVLAVHFHSESDGFFFALYG